MRRLALLPLMAPAWPALAEPAGPPPQILVAATGSARTPPDMATVQFTLRGEGATSDAATAGLRDAAARMSKGIAGLLGSAHDYHSSSFALAQVRSKDCDASNYGQQRLSTGPCAILGYVATMSVTVDTPRVADAGTLAGLVGRLGGLDASIRSFWLRDGATAHAQAMAAALTNARAEAEQIAKGAGARLGPLVRVQDADYQEVTLGLPQAAAAMSVPAPPPPPPPPPPPVRVDLAPEPILTSVRVMAAYGLER